MVFPFSSFGSSPLPLSLLFGQLFFFSFLTWKATPRHSSNSKWGITRTYHTLSAPIRTYPPMICCCWSHCSAPIRAQAFIFPHSTFRFRIKQRTGNDAVHHMEKSQLLFSQTYDVLTQQLPSVPKVCIRLRVLPLHPLRF